MILVARIGATHGVRGEVRIKAFTADPLALKAYGPLSAADGRTFSLERLRPAKEVVVAKLSGVDTHEAAEALNGTELFVDRAALPGAEEDEFYHADLIGLPAEGVAGEILGTIVAVHNFGAGDFFEIAPSRGPSLLVPFTKESVPIVDLDNGKLVVVPPVEAADGTHANKEG